MKKYIKQILNKTGWMSILESIIFIILGIILVIKPEGTVKAISWILGAVFIIVGIFKIVGYFEIKGNCNSFYNFNLIYGLTAIVIGIIVIAYMNVISSIFRIVIGVWIIYTSFIRMTSALQLRKKGNKIWTYSLILAILMFVCGVYIIAKESAIIVTIGGIMIIYAIIDIIEDIIFMKNVKEKI